MNKNSVIYVAGHTGLVGSAIVRALKEQGYKNLILKTSSELDLTIADRVDMFFHRCRPEYVIFAAGKVGGIFANVKYPADFIYQNLAMGINVIYASKLFDVKRLLYLGSGCMYPKYTGLLNETHLVTGELEPTSEPYAIAKIACLKLCHAFKSQYNKDFVSAIPTNVYGPNDRYDEDSHVIPALISKIHDAKVNGKKSVTLWGSGNQVRQFLFSWDLADACIFLMNKRGLPNMPINIGGEATSIRDLAETIKDIIGYSGKITFNHKSEGTHRRILDATRLKDMGWSPRTPLMNGLQITYETFKASLGG